MAKQTSKRSRQNETGGLLPAEQSHLIWSIILGIVAFFMISMCVPTQIASTSAMVCVPALVLAVLCRKRLAGQVNWIVVVMALMVLMTGLSVLYAVNQALGLIEFLGVLMPFGFFLLVLLMGGSGTGKRLAASVIAVATAALSLVSIDMLSTRVLWKLFLQLVPLVSDDYTGISGLEVGVRMTSLYKLPNIYAGIAGLGVLVALGLAVSGESKQDKILSRVCLFWNALGFVLAFSMGGTATLAVAFLMILFAIQQERRMPLLVLMVETLVMTLAATFPIFLTSFQTWNGSQPIPLLCALLGAGILCLVDCKLGQPLAEGLKGYTRGAGIAIAGILVLLTIFGLAAYHLTGAINLDEGETLRRAAYPEGGSYSLDIQSDGDLTVTIESQNELDTFNHTSTVIYEGDAQNASFAVPEDSLVVYFNFTAVEDLTLDSATVSGTDEISLRLGYLLLPGFMANRLQGLWANENAIQRLAFFQDGLTIFQMSPIIGMGAGAFQSLYEEVQQFDYTTAYVHNHYIQLLLETGIIGLALFLALLILCAIALWKNRKTGEDGEMTAALLACLVFMALHSAVEANFSLGTYRMVAYAIFGLIACYGGGQLPLPTKKK